MTIPANPQSAKSILRPLIAIALGIFIIGIFGCNLLIMERSISTIVSLFALGFSRIFIDALPFLLFGIITSGLIAAFIRPRDVVRYLPKNRLIAVLFGVFLGIIFPVGEYGVVPVVRRLFKKGVPLSVGVSFLLAAPFINPIAFASSYIAFGFGTILIARFVVTALIALVIGLVFMLNSEPSDILLAVALPDENEGDDMSRPNYKQGFSQAMTIARHELFEMGRFLLISCLLAAALQTLINPSDLDLIGQNSLQSILAMQGFAFVQSISSTADSVFVLAFVNSLSLGAIIAFLVLGSMVDIKSTLLLMTVFKKRAIIYLIILTILMNLLVAVLMNMQFL